MDLVAGTVCTDMQMQGSEISLAPLNIIFRGEARGKNLISCGKLMMTVGSSNR